MKYFACQVCTLLWLFVSVNLMAQYSGARARITKVEYSNNQVRSGWNNIDLTRNENIRLTSSQNYLHFQFLNTSNPTNKTFYYRLVGLDYAWIRCDDCDKIHYAHLTGGDYTFEVKTTINQELPARFKFFIEGDILHKWWFVPMLFFYLFVFLGICIYFIILYNFRQKLREQRLIHTSKMASMAELTEGIAHEIQNPLNFVNNYSEVSSELVDEIVEERAKMAERDDELIGDLLVDLQDNLLKINANGKRANEIVKGMLRHSRKSSGFKDLSNVNDLVKEYLRQAYETQVNRDQTFYAEYQMEFDKSLPQVEMVVMDIGQVLLNLINNAFYAVNEKRKQKTKDYIPSVKIITQQQNGTVEILVKDNGDGIAPEIRDKIFQPFFTTKPAGQGSGLGLSVSDTIMKAHGGELKLETAEGEGATFTLVLPL